MNALTTARRVSLGAHTGKVGLMIVATRLVIYLQPEGILLGA